MQQELFAIPQLSALAELRGNPLVLYAAAIADDVVPVLYECLSKQGPVERMDLVLVTSGGTITSIRRIAHVLREYAHSLNILVPYRAWSSGTLLCLGADELILGPLAELSPIDAQSNSADFSAASGPGSISSEEVRTFSQMAEAWFGVTREEDRLQVLALMAQRFFPTSLSAIYRSDRLVRRVANELLMYQLPDAEAHVREQIVEQLISGYDAHDYPITRAEARALGLRVKYATLEEERLLWGVWQACDALITGAANDPERNVLGLIAGAGFSARLLRQGNFPLSPSPDEAALQLAAMTIGWEIAV